MDAEPIELHDGSKVALREDHDASTCRLCPGCAARLDRIERTLDRLGPLIDTLEQAAPLFGAMATDANGKRPSAFKMAMGAAKAARGA
jgi:hypothetical protein